jgi:hypothetical protein
MRWLVAVACGVLVCTGCRSGPHFGRYAEVCAPDADRQNSAAQQPPGQEAVCAPRTNACPPPQQQCQPPCQPKEVPREVSKPREVTPPPESQAAVTQDILLVPRMVYVPYVPHVPVAPARLAMAAPAGRVIEEQREVETPKDTPRSRELDQCKQELEDLKKRLAELQSRMVCPAPAPAPPACTLPCGPTLR